MQRMDRRKYIVMVEDDPDMHYLFKRVFANLHIYESLMLFDNAQAALDFLEQEGSETSIIISDVNMPMLSGLDFRKKINAQLEPYIKSIPFVFLSTSAVEKEVAEAYQLSIQGFFKKGETITDLEKTIKTIVNYWGKSMTA
jgi:CheY-like chemotaxis protein